MNTLNPIKELYDLYSDEVKTPHVASQLLSRN